ncbi:MAG TPA: RsfA family transcriptional regulator [Bacillota bacterium]
MNTTRQDAWTEDEDLLLAETVLRYIRQGKTQLEAFKDVAKQLSRTPAACGFRWNATIRKHYHEAIEQAKETRKQTVKSSFNRDQLKLPLDDERDAIESAIIMLENMKSNFFAENGESLQFQYRLEEENKQLRKKLERYENAWREMENLWEWAQGHENHNG